MDVMWRKGEALITSYWETNEKLVVMNCTLTLEMDNDFKFRWKEFFRYEEALTGITMTQQHFFVPLKKVESF